MQLLFIDPRFLGWRHFKLLVEAIQLLYGAHHACGGLLAGAPVGAYKATHLNHPIARWVRKSGANYKHSAEHATRILSEYYSRYGTGKVHGCAVHLD